MQFDTTKRHSVVVVLVLASLLVGCAFTELKKEKAQINTLFSLIGQVSHPSESLGKVIVILLAEKEGKLVPIRYVLPDHNGNFSIIVKKGVYYLGAFEDLNENLRHDPGEYAGYFGSPDPIDTPKMHPGQTAGRYVQELDIHLSPAEIFFDGLETEENLELQEMLYIKIGTIARLDDVLFDQANGSLGYWKPLTFIKQFGAGIYFLEPYDPNRIPVLFVHGANGTPAGWKYMVSHLNKKRYQAWFFYYPSGFRLEGAAKLLHGVIDLLHDKYEFDRLYITAHSMGGLVSREAILLNHYQYHQDYIKLFISISTPWGGVSMAQKGVENAPAAIPSWHDVKPTSDFIKKIYSQPIPSDLPFHLFFSHRGNCSLFMGNNDGVVELKSELDYRAQVEAVGLHGFYEDHTSILESHEMIERFLMVLESVW